MCGGENIKLLTSFLFYVFCFVFFCFIFFFLSFCSLLLSSDREFFHVFFLENPAGRRLFEHSGLQVQGRALVSMIGMIIKSLEDFATFSGLVVQLGGRHEIYGVNVADYECFARVLSQTVGRLVGGENEAAVCGFISFYFDLSIDFNLCL
jgi:hypothetical protein